MSAPHCLFAKTPKREVNSNRSGEANEKANDEDAWPCQRAHHVGIETLVEA